MNQTPSPDTCLGGRLVFTCVASGTSGGVAWRRNSDIPQSIEYNDAAVILDNDFMLNVVYYTIHGVGNIDMTTTATIESVSAQLNGSSIGCTTDAVNYRTLTIHVAGIPNLQLIIIICYNRSTSNISY